MAKTITLRVPDETYRIFSQRARSERRSLSNYIEVAALGYSMETDFVDTLEMEGILSDKKLIRRLKQGSRRAQLMKGKFVE